MRTNRIKRLPSTVKKDLQLQNLARRLAGLSMIQIKVINCYTCGRLFESAGNRNCGCNTQTQGYIAGRDVI